MLQRCKLRLRRLFHPSELRDELEFHLEQLAETLMDQGMAPEAARREARLRFGNSAAFAQQSRELFSFGLLEEVMRDLAYAFRSWRRTPAIAIAAVLSIGLGVGANTSLFSFVDALMLRALPVSNPQELVRIVDPNSREFGFPSPYYDRFRLIDGPFTGVAAIHNTQRANVEVNRAREATPIEVGLVSDNYFDLLGVHAALGRFPQPGEMNPTAMISYGYWDQRFGRDPRVLGSTIAINGTVFHIVGVTAPAFSGDRIGKPVSLWIPLARQSLVMLERPQRDVPWLRLIARLRPGVSPAQAAAVAQSVYIGAVRDTPGLRAPLREAMLRKTVEVESAARGFASEREKLARPLTTAGVIVALALLIACANVANLLLARSAARQPEIDLRLALGAGTFRIARQLLTENLALAAAGGLAGWLFACWASKAAPSLIASGLNPVVLDIQPNARLVGFAFALTLLTGLLFGVLPAWRASTGNVVRSALPRFSHPVLVLQIALTLAILASAGVFTATLRNLRSRDLGFERDDLLLVWASPEQAGSRGRDVATLFKTLPQHIRSLAGVTSASASVIGPLEGSYAEEGAGPTPNIVAPGFFETVGMRILAGRDFNDRDDEHSHPVAVVSEAFARELFGEANALGRTIDFRRSSVEIVGVVSDTRFNTVREKNRRMLFIPYTQDADHLFSLCLVIRTAGHPPPAFGARIRDELRSAYRTLPVVRIDSFTEQLDRSLLVERLLSGFADSFALLAVALASVGLYGAVSFQVASRTREIGVRIAVGAARRQVVAMVLRQSAMVTAAGLALGIPVALSVTRISQSVLFGLRANDPLILGGSAVLIVLIAMVAAFPPAWRAASTNPVTALRHD